MRLGGHLLDLGFLAQVAGVEPEPVDAGLERGERHLVVKVDVGHDRHRRAGDDVGQTLGRRLLVARAADDVGAGRRQRIDLRQRAVDVRRLRRRHRLHGDGCAVADRHVADHDPPGRPPSRQERRRQFHISAGC
jgi:hypothetical protein